MASSQNAVLIISLVNGSFFLWLWKYFTHTHIIPYSQTPSIQSVVHPLLFTCSDYVRLNGCSEVLLIEDMKENVKTCSEKSHHSVIY